MPLFKRDLKSYLLLSSSSILSLLKITPKIHVLPSVIIYPSNVCNYDCIMCTNARSRVQSHESMDFRIMKKAIDECSNFMFKPRLHFSGLGEPLVYPKIKEVMELCREKKLKWGMTTNGYLLEKYAQDLVLNNCSAINISIHGDSVIHDSITKTKGAFDKVISGIKKIDELRKSSKKNTPVIAINCVFNNDNIPHMKQILNEFIKLPINSVTFQHLTFYETDLEGSSSFLIKNKDKLDKLIEFVDFVSKGRFPIKVNIFPKIKRSNLVRYYTDKGYKKSYGSCIIAWLSARIYPNGDVGTCMQVFGNIGSEPLKKIINSENAVKFRNLIRKQKFNAPICFRCCHKNYCGALSEK